MSGIFQSFFLGGFECSTHVRRDGKQIDAIRAMGHDGRTAEDYALLLQAGVRTVRDGLRWHLVEVSDGVYDWSSFLPMLDASIEADTQVIWDLCHWGLPVDLDIFSPSFVRRFAAFAAAVATIVAEKTSSVPFYCPVNEISFWAWIGGDLGQFGPHATGRGPEMKRQLVRASVAAMRKIRDIDPRARFVQAEPVINVVADENRPAEEADAARATAAQFETWDMLRGDAIADNTSAGTLGAPEMLDIIGVNFYWDNEWILGGARTPLGHPRHRPLHVILKQIWDRYRRPLILSETGAEGMALAGWLGYISSEVRQAQRAGVDVAGICIYPVMDYPGWDDDRHCPCGLIEVGPQWHERNLRMDLVDEARVQMSSFE